MRPLLLVTLLPLFSSSAWAETGLRFGFQTGGGIALQNDAYLVGVRLAVRHEALPRLELDAGLFSGLGPYLHGVRPQVHAKLDLIRTRPFRLYALGGRSMWIYWPRGDYGEYCEARDLRCSGNPTGTDLGLGLAVGPLAFEAVVGTGALPLYSMLVTAAVWP